MKNSGLLLFLLGVGAYFLLGNKTAGSGGITDPADCLEWDEALGYFSMKWLASGRLPNKLPNLNVLIPPGGGCPTKAYIDRIVRDWRDDDEGIA